MAKPGIPRSRKDNNKAGLNTAEVAAEMKPKMAAPIAPSFIATQIDLETQIRQRAYELYQERGCTPGQQDDDWLRAEQEIRAHGGQHNA